MSSDASTHRHTNRLIDSTSPYLLQHAHNPVDWYPWGPEAFEAAETSGKPIFLSVGYSTCYWCHVMERQCFENEEIAAVMNEKFINIKVDREERPDVDQVYMTAVQILTRQGGWPMSVFLTDELQPFFGGTYFPPDDGYGRPGFPRVLTSIADAYHNKRGQVDRSAEEIVRLLGHVAEPRQPKAPIQINLEWVERLIARSTADYDTCYGGFSGAPKFPRETLLELMLAYIESPQATEDANQFKEMLTYTLDMMADGGIRDQLGGAFHRYSTDEKWLVPHFEIMLYDNAMLAGIYARSWKACGEASHARVARGILDFVLAEMTSPAGAFYTAFDAEVDGQEGLNYLWTEAQVRENLAPFAKEEVELFLRVYGLLDGPNFADPHHGTGMPDKKILFIPRPLEDVATSLKTTEEALDAHLAPMRLALFAVRARRKQPLLDTKVLTSWNALMIGAFAIAGRVLSEAKYVQAAVSAAEFLWEQHRKADGSLIRTSRGEVRSEIPAFLDDYAFLAQACLELHLATADSKWEQRARDLVKVMKEKFLDHDLGGFYFSAAEAKDLIMRQKTGADSPLPSGNGVAAMCLLRLGDVETAQGVLAVFAQSVEDQAEGMSTLVEAALRYVESNEPFSVATAAQAAGHHDARPDSVAELAKSVVSLAARWVSTTELAVEVQMAGGYHINSNQPAEGMIATTLSVMLPANSGIASRVEYPEGEERQFTFADAPLTVYDGQTTIAVKFERAPASGTKIRISLSYQACSDDACLPPATRTIEVTAP